MKTSRSEAWVSGAALLGGAGLIALLPLACRGRQQTEAALPPLVSVHQVAPARALPLELRGSVVAAQRVRLGFRQGGVLASLDVREGGRVTAGQVVGRLNDVDARSTVRAATAAREKAQRDAQRAERLAGQGALPTSARDDARSALEATEAHLTQARENLERTVLSAPVSGTVFARLAEPGETIGEGRPVYVIDSSSHVVVRAGANERERARLTSQRQATLLLEGGARRAGRVTSVATTPNPEDGLYTIEVTPQAGSPALTVGALVQLLFEGTHASDVVRIPLEALVHRLDHDFVFVLETTTTGGASPVVRQRAIEAGPVDGLELVVRRGLTGGESIVAEGAYFLQDGQAVRVLE